MIPGGVESNSTSACCFAGEVLAADHLPRTFNRPVFLSSFRDAGPATKNPTQHTSCISHRSVVDPTLCTASTLSMPVAAGVKGFTREVNTASTVGMAKGCAEGRLDDLRGLLVADDGLEGKALSTVTVSQVPVDQAAGAGQTKVLDCLCEKSEGTMHPSATGLEMAAAAGKIDTLEWAHARNLEGFGPELMDVAAWQGRLPVLKWLRANRKEGCTANSMKWAAKRGRLKVLRWLHDNLGQACTAEGLEAASTAGHLKVVAWFLRNRAPLRGFHTKEAIVGAASNGHADVLKLLLSGFREERHERQQQSKWALTLAADGGYTECVALLRKAGWREEHAPSRGVLPGEADQDVVTTDNKNYDNNTSANNSNNSNSSNDNDNNNNNNENDPASPCRTLACTARGDQQDASNKHDFRLYHDPLASKPIDHHHTPTVRTQFLSATGEGEHTPRRHVLLRDCHKRGNSGFAVAPEAPWRNKENGMRDCYGGGSGGGFSMAPEAPWHDGDDRLHGCYERGNNGFAAAPEVPWHTRDNGLHDYHKRGNGGFAIAPEAWLGNDGFAKATQALDAGEKVRVRDIWTPVPAAPSPFRGLEARLNLGALDKESQDPVISAYISGLDRKLKASALALARRRHPNADNVLAHAAFTMRGCTKKTRVHQRTFRTRGLKPFHPVVVEPRGGHGESLHPFPPMIVLPACAAGAAGAGAAGIGSSEGSPTTPMLLSKRNQWQQQQHLHLHLHLHQRQYQQHQHQQHQDHQHQDLHQDLHKNHQPHHHHHHYHQKHHHHHRKHQHQPQQHQHQPQQQQREQQQQRKACYNHRGKQTQGGATATVRPTPPADPDHNRSRRTRTAPAPQTTSTGIFLSEAEHRAGKAPRTWAGVSEEEEAKQRAGTAPARPGAPPSGYSRSRRLLLLQASAKEAGLMAAVTS